jgi:hypothetical protein
MISVRPLTEEERTALKRMRRQELGRGSLRAQIVLLSEQHGTVPHIAARLEMRRVPVRSWLERFESWGPAGLDEAERSGRPRQRTRAMDSILGHWLEEDPPRGHERFRASWWTSPMRMRALVQRFTLGGWAHTVRQAWRRVGLRWGRPRRAMPMNTDPQTREQPWARVKAVVDAGPEAGVLSGDDSRVQTLPLIRARWPWLGQQSRVPTPGANTARAIFGALHIRTGPWSYLRRQHRSKADCMALLEALLAVYPTPTIRLMVDHYRSHPAPGVDDWLSDHPRLPRPLLPTYGAHLTPVDSSWLRMKHEIAANRLCGSINLILQTVATFFVRMTPEQALTWAAAA